MKRHLKLSVDPIDESACISTRRLSNAAGAAVYFAGVVREIEGDETICGIDYEAYEKMVRHQFQLIFDQIERRWPIESIRLVHRIGFVPVNAPSLWVEVIGAHRQEAFDACQFLIDEMKRLVPIWKKPLKAR